MNSKFLGVSQGQQWSWDPCSLYTHTYRAQTHNHVHKFKHVGLGAVKPAVSLSVSLSFLTESSHTSTHLASILSPLLFFANSLPSASFSPPRPWKNRNWMQSEYLGKKAWGALESSFLEFSCMALSVLQDSQVHFLKVVQIFQATFCVVWKLHAFFNYTISL